MSGRERPTQFRREAIVRIIQLPSQYSLVLFIIEPAPEGGRRGEGVSEGRQHVVEQLAAESS